MPTLETYIDNRPLQGDEALLHQFEVIAERLFSEANFSSEPKPLHPSRIIVDDNGDLLKIENCNADADRHYIAPEVLRGQSPNFQSFVYNLGAVFYFMATKKAPYEADHENAPVDDGPGPMLMEPNRLNGGISPALGALIRKMLSVAPSIRHKSIASYRLDIEHVKRGEWPVNAPVSINVHDNSISADTRTGRRPRLAGRKRIAVSNDRIARVREKQQSSLRRSGNGIVYLFLLAAGIWAAWYFNIEEYWGDLDRLSKRLIPALNREVGSRNENGPGADIRKNNNAGSANLPQNGTAGKQSGYDRERMRLEKKYSEQRERDLSRRKSEEESQRTSKSHRGTWNDPQFLAGARLYNNAIEQVDAYAASVRSGDPNPRILDGAEDKIRNAIGYFRSCLNRAPEEVPIKRYIDNCYKLLAKTRQSKLLDLSQ